MALGQGWRLGFLGLLHMDVFRQRLEEVGRVMSEMVKESMCGNSSSFSDYCCGCQRSVLVAIGGMWGYVYAGGVWL